MVVVDLGEFLFLLNNSFPDGCETLFELQGMSPRLVTLPFQGPLLLLKEVVDHVNALDTVSFDGL